MKKVAIFGLGQRFHRNQSFIEMNYPKAVYTDSDVRKVGQYANGITVDDLKKNIEEYEKVIITVTDIFLINIIVEMLKLKDEQIVLLDTELEKKDGKLMHYYGEGNIDALLDTLIYRIGKRPSKVRYLEIGTNNPIYSNNSYHLYHMGSRGVLIDPLPVVKKYAELFRPEDRIITKAITDEMDQKVISFYVDEDVSSGISSAIPDHYIKWGGHTPKEIQVEACHICEILEKIEFLPDIIFVDTEGLDNRIVRSIPFNLYKIPVVLVETIEMESEEYVAFLDYMKENGYSLYVVSDGINSIFVRTEVWKKC